MPASLTSKSSEPSRDFPRVKVRANKPLEEIISRKPTELNNKNEEIISRKPTDLNNKNTEPGDEFPPETSYTIEGFRHKNLTHES